MNDNTLRGKLTARGNLSATVNTIVYAHNYNDLTNKPKINNVTLEGNKTASDLGLITPSDIPVTSVNEQTGDVELSGDNINYDLNTTVNAKINDLESQIVTSGVHSVNGQTGTVILTGANIDYSAGVSLSAKIDAVEGEIPTIDYPVTSVNSKTGAVVLDGTDIEYSEGVSLSDKIDAVEGEIPTVDYPVTSVNNKTGAVDILGTDIAMTDLDPTPVSTAIGDLTQLTTTNQNSLVDAVNEVNGAITNTTITTKTHCKYMELPNRIVFIVVDGATNNEELDIPAPSSTQYFAGLSQSNAYAAFSISAAKKVTIITSGATQVYGNFVYFKAV